MQGFYVLVKVDLVIVYILKVYCENSSSTLLRKNMFNSFFAFFFWKACTFSSFERFLYWKSRNYSQYFSLEILVWDLFTRIINYWVSIFKLYITWGAFSLVCVLSFFFFLSFFFVFFCYRYFFLTDTNASQDYREGRGSPYFSFFPLPPVHEHSFSSSRFLLLLFNRSFCNYQTDSW